MTEDKKAIKPLDIKIQFVFLDPTSSLLPGHTQVPTRIFLESLTAVSNTKSTPIRIINRSELIESVSRKFDTTFADVLKIKASSSPSSSSTPVPAAAAAPTKGGKGAPPPAAAIPVPVVSSTTLSHADMTRVLQNFTPEDIANELRNRVAIECGRTLAIQARNSIPDAVQPPPLEFPPRDAALDATYALIEETGEKLLSNSVTLLFLILGGPTGVAECASLISAISKNASPIIPILESEKEGNSTETLSSLYESAGWSANNIPSISIIGEPICLELLNTPKALQEQRLLAEAQAAQALQAKTIELRTGVNVKQQQEGGTTTSPSGDPLLPSEQFSAEIDIVWGHVPSHSSAVSLRSLKRTFKAGEATLKVSEILERTSRGHSFYPKMSKWAQRSKCSYNLVRDIALLTLHLDEAIVTAEAIVSLFFKSIVQHLEALESYLFYLASASVSIVPDFEDLSISGGFDTIEGLAAAASTSSASTSSSTTSSSSSSTDTVAGNTSNNQSNTLVTKMASKAAEMYMTSLAHLPTGSTGVATVLYALVEAVSMTAVSCDIGFHIDSNRLIAVPSTPLFLSSLVAVDEPASSGTSSSGRVGGSTRFGAIHLSYSSSSSSSSSTTRVDANESFDDPMSYRGHGSSIHEDMVDLEDNKDDSISSSSSSRPTAIGVEGSTTHIDPADTVLSSGALPTSVLLQLPSLSRVSQSRFVPFSLLIARYKEAYERSWMWFDHYSSASFPGAVRATSATYVRLVRAAASLGCSIYDLCLGNINNNNKMRGVPILVADRVIYSSLIPLDEWPLPVPPPDRAPNLDQNETSSSISNQNDVSVDNHLTSNEERLVVKHFTPGSTGTEFEELAAMTSITRDLTRKTLLFRSIEALLQASDTAAAANFVSLFERRIMNGSEAAETHQWNLSKWDWADELEDDPVLLVEAMVQAAVDAGSVSLAVPAKLEEGGGGDVVHSKGNSLVGGGTACVSIRDPTSSALIVAYHTLTPRRRVEFKQEWHDDIVPHSSASKPDLNFYLTKGNMSRPVSKEDKGIQKGPAATSAKSNIAIGKKGAVQQLKLKQETTPEVAFIDSGYRNDFDHSGPPLRTLCSLYPADHSVIRTVSDGYADGEPKTSVTVVKDGIYFGLRDTGDTLTEDMSPSLFFADFNGDRLPGSSGVTSGARCTIRAISFPQKEVFQSSIPTATKKNKNRVVIVASYTTLDGLFVEVSSDGRITQRHQRPSGSHSATRQAMHLSPFLRDGAMQSISNISSSSFDAFSNKSTISASALVSLSTQEVSLESKTTDVDIHKQGNTQDIPKSTKRPESANKVPFPNVKVPLPSPLGTLEPVCAAQFPPWPAWLPEISRSIIGPNATTVRILRFNVKHILRSNGHVAWILPSDLAKRVLSFALKASFDIEKTSTTTTEGGVEGHSVYKDPWWLDSTKSLRIDTFPDGQRFASVTFSVTFDKKGVEEGGGGGGKQEQGPSTIKLVLPPVEVHVTHDSATRASCVVRYDACPVPDPNFIAPQAPEEKVPILFKRAKAIMQYRDAQNRLNEAHSSERRAQLGGLWAGLETDSSGFSPLFDGNGTGPQLGRSSLAVYPGSRRLSLAIHADGTHIVTEGSRERVTSTCRGFATTEIDSTFEAVGYGHIRNDPNISTSQMGPRTRSVTTLHDGASIAVDYDCSITAAASSRVRIHRPDGAAIIALDTGLVHFRPPGVTAGPLPDPTKLDSALAARVRRESANASSSSPSSLLASTLAVSLSDTTGHTDPVKGENQSGKQSQRARSSSPLKSSSSTKNVASDTTALITTQYNAPTANFHWTGKFAEGSATEVTTADLLKDELHWDILYAAASMELGRGIVPDVPPAGGAYDFFIVPIKRGKDKSLVMRTLDQERNQFYLHRRNDGISGLVPTVILGGCVIPKGVNGDDLSIVPSFDKNTTPLLTAAVPGSPPGSTIVVPRINSPRPPSVFIIHHNGTGIRLISPEERDNLSRVALSSDLPQSAFLLVRDVKNRTKNDTTALFGDDREMQVKRKHVELSQKGGWLDQVEKENEGKNNHARFAPPPPKAAGGGQRIPHIAPVDGNKVVQTVDLETASHHSKRSPAPIGSTGPPPILQVFVASPLATDSLLSLKSRSYTGFATPSAYPTDSSGSGIFLTTSSTTPLNSFTDEIRTSQAAWVVNMGPRMARFTVPEVFGETARISPAMISQQKRKETAAALLRALDAAGDPFNSTSGGRSGVPQQPFVKQIVTTTFTGGSVGNGGGGDGKEGEGTGGVKFQHPLSTHSESDGKENDDDLSSIAIAVRERILPRIICIVPAILAPPYALILPSEGGKQTRNPNVTVPFDTPTSLSFFAPPLPLFPAPALWRSIRQSYNLSREERSILEQDEHQWRIWRMKKAKDSLAFESIETRSKEDISIEMKAAHAVKEARARFELSTTESTKVFNPLSRVRAAASALAFGERMRKDLEESAKARQEAKLAREAAEFAAAEVAAMQLLHRDVLSARGKFSTLGSTEIDIALSDSNLLSDSSSSSRNADNLSIIEVDDVSPGGLGGGGRGPPNTVVVAIAAADGEVLRVRVPVPNKGRLPPGVSSGEPGGLLVPLLPPLARMELHADSVNSRVGSSRDTGRTTTTTGDVGLLSSSSSSSSSLHRPIKGNVYEVLIPSDAIEGEGDERRHIESSRKSTSSDAIDKSTTAYENDIIGIYPPVSQVGSITSEGSSLVTAPDMNEIETTNSVFNDLNNMALASNSSSNGNHHHAAQLARERQIQEDEAIIQRAVNPKTGKPYDEATKQRMRVAAVRKREQELGRSKAAALEAKRIKELSQAPSTLAAQAAATAEAVRKKDLVEKKKLGYGIPATANTTETDSHRSKSPIKDIEDALKKESPGILLSALVDSSLKTGATTKPSYRGSIAGHSTIGLGNGLSVIQETKQTVDSLESTIGGNVDTNNLEDGDDISRLEAMIKSQSGMSAVSHNARTNTTSTSAVIASGGGGIAAARALTNRGGGIVSGVSGNGVSTAREFAGDGVSALDIPSNAAVPSSQGVLAVPSPVTGSLPSTSSAIITPAAVRFGTLVAGTSYEFEVLLHNTATGLLRFRVGRNYAQGRGGGSGNAVVATHEPGPIARGMARIVTIRINCRVPGVLSEIVSLILPGEEIGIPVSAKVIAKGEGGESTTFGVRIV